LQKFDEGCGCFNNSKTCIEARGGEVQVDATKRVKQNKVGKSKYLEMALEWSKASKVTLNPTPYLDVNFLKVLWKSHFSSQVSPNVILVGFRGDKQCQFRAGFCFFSNNHPTLVWTSLNEQSPSSTRCSLWLSCGWTSPKLMFGFTLVINCVRSKSYTCIGRKIGDN